MKSYPYHNKSFEADTDENDSCIFADFADKQSRKLLESAKGLDEEYGQ